MTKATKIAIRRELRNLKEVLGIIFSQFAMAPILLGKEVLTQDGHSIGSITDMYLDLKEKTGQIVVAKDQHISVDEITAVGSKVIISRTRRELVAQKKQEVKLGNALALDDLFCAGDLTSEALVDSSSSIQRPG